MLLIILLLFLFKDSSAVSHRQGMLCRFRNIANYDIILWWITPYKKEELRFFGHLQSNGGIVSFTANPGSKFLWASPGKEKDKSQRTKPFVITEDQILYLYTDKNNPADIQTITKTNQEIKYLDQYYATHKRHWLSTYGRPVPTIPFIKSFQIQSKLSNAYFWKCDPNIIHAKKKVEAADPDPVITLANRVTRLFSTKQSEKISNCQNNNNGQKIKFQIEKLHNMRPKIYKISNFISEYEAKHIIDVSLNSMHRSTTGNGRNLVTDPTRTSSNTWLAMNQTKVIQTIYERISHMLGLDSYTLTAHANIMDKGVASHMEVIHFDTNQFYARHFDNAVGNDIYLRFITIQVILRVSDDLEGGRTLFIEAEDMNGETQVYAVDSEQYSAVFWYNVLDDGNLDETVMYSNEKVRNGNQWMFHIHIWDPSLPIGGDPSMPNHLMFKTEL